MLQFERLKFIAPYCGGLVSSFPLLNLTVERRNLCTWQWVRMKVFLALNLKVGAYVAYNLTDRFSDLIRHSEPHSVLGI